MRLPVGQGVTTLLCAVFFAITAVTTGCAATLPGINRLGYAIQMGAFADVNNAERFTATLQRKGIEAFYFRKDNGVYAVRFGDFPTKEKARTVARKLVADRLIDTYYIAPPNEIVFGRAKQPGGQKPAREETRAVSPSTTSRGAPESRGARIGETADITRKTGTRDEKDMGAIAARTAERFVGIPYRWGGDNVVDGMDCSGFVRAVYNLCGVSIPRTSQDQYHAGEPVPLAELRDGDLVFFGAGADRINHVGIYVGSGRFVHAPRRGEEIRVSSVSDAYFEKRFIGARRYFP